MCLGNFFETSQTKIASIQVRLYFQKYVYNHSKFQLILELCVYVMYKDLQRIYLQATKYDLHEAHGNKTLVLLQRARRASTPRPQGEVRAL